MIEIILVSLAFGFVSIKSFRWALFVFILSLPAYLIRREIGPLPTTLLEIFFGIIFISWLAIHSKNDYSEIKAFINSYKVLASFILMVFVFSIISIFISDMWWYSFGQWRAYFLEPLLIFIVLIGRRKHLNFNSVAIPLAISTLSVSAFAIFQQITGLGLPPNNDGRITSFFTSPNSVGLYIVPPLFLGFTILINGLQKKQKILYLLFPVIILGLITIVYTKSLGTLIALVGGLLLGLMLLTKKPWLVSIITLLVAGFIFLFPPTKELILSKNRSGSNRLILWQYSSDYLTSSPKNFIFGTGIRQFFRKIQKPHYDQKQMERLIYPHNIFLNFWTEIGLLGMLGMVSILTLLSKYSFEIYKKNILIGAGLTCAVAAVVVHGMIDVPYFKNDLAMMFWIITALIINTHQSTEI